MIGPITYTFNNVPWPKERLARTWIAPTETFVGTEVFPITIDTMSATLYLCNPPDQYIKESRYIKILPELLQTYPSTISTDVAGNKLSYTFDPEVISASANQHYALEFTVQQGSSHYVGKVVISITEA